MPVVWLGRLAGLQAIGRVTGVDLVAALCRAGGRRGPFRVALVGSEPELIDRASKTIEEFAPGVRAVFTVSPPFRAWTADEVERFRGGIASAEPDLVLVALGCPRQERLIAEWYPLAPRAVWIGVGGTFDFFAGRRRRAPRWMQRAGLEWSYRLVQDPRRLGRRYFGRDLPALARLTLSVLRERRRGGDSGSTELQR
jgi:N-acetylglucosaminyldiphosphoundecaprenol N-acetyl-beta-D-mannosaminyltransferase